MFPPVQGLGKTVSTIALLVSNHVEPVKPWGRVQVDLNQPKPPKRLKWDPPSGAATPSRTAAAGGAAAAQAEQPAAAPLPAADSGAAAATGGGVPVSDGAAGARGPQGAAGGGGAGAPPIAASGVAPAAAAETSVRSLPCVWTMSSPAVPPCACTRCYGSDGVLCSPPCVCVTYLSQCIAIWKWMCVNCSGQEVLPFSLGLGDARASQEAAHDS